MCQGAITDTVDYLLAWVEEVTRGSCMHLERDISGKMKARHLEVFRQKVRERLDPLPPDDEGGKGYQRREITMFTGDELKELSEHLL
jgi:hypothetical protein